MEKYQIVQILGQGSYGTVFLIRDQKGKQYALKKVQVDPFQVEEALKEIEVTTNFMHPNLIRIYESYYCDNTQKLQILMEYCQRGDLLNYFVKKQKQISVDEIITIFRQIVKAFLAMNAKGVIHRDLKPENVLIKEDKTIKIADFGCARSINQNQLSKIQKMSYEKGTPIYCSPQELQNQEYSAKCDIWSAGCLLFFIYYKYHPFIDSSIEGSLEKIKRLTQNKRIQLRPETDPTIGKIISLSLIYKDEERASWRQLWLSRLFSKKIKDVKSFLMYLRSVSNIANWMTKQFWKHRKEMEIGKNKNELFAYFTIKFQHTNNQMALKIINKQPQFQYLFESEAYKQFDPTEYKNRQIVKELQEDSGPTYKYFQSIKEHMATKQVYKHVKEKELVRNSCFIDLDNSIKTAFRILEDILPQISTSSSEMSEDSFGTRDSSSNGKCELVWLIMARWVNFQFWFSYEKNPRVQDILNQSSISKTGLMSSIDHEIEKYNYGVVQ